jgi:hypothetical protein
VVILGGTNATITDVEDLLDEFHRDHVCTGTISGNVPFRLPLEWLTHINSNRSPP